jgi:hypothetical protein
LFLLLFGLAMAVGVAVLWVVFGFV